MKTSWFPHFHHYHHHFLTILVTNDLPSADAVSSIAKDSMYNPKTGKSFLPFIFRSPHRFLRYSRSQGSSLGRPGTKLDSSKLLAPSTKSPKLVPVIKAAPPNRNTRQPQVVSHPARCNGGREASIIQFPIC